VSNYFALTGGGRSLWQQSENVVFEQSSWTPACGGQRRMKILGCRRAAGNQSVRRIFRREMS
jgi:hypothetical protein